MGSSAHWKVVSFKRTHLVERLGLLTLIILGEGIIVMLKAVNSVEKGSVYGRGWSASIFFIVACAVGILVSDIVGCYCELDSDNGPVPSLHVLF